MRVVVVEDEIRIREGIEKLLAKMENIELVGEAADGEAGLALLKELVPDAVITDIMMPGMDGLEMLTQMASEGLPTRAIVLSAYSEFEYARTAMKLGVTEYLLKPISYDDFANAIENTRRLVRKDRQEKPSQIGTLEQIFHSVLNDYQEITAEVQSYLHHNYGISETEQFGLLNVYLGDGYEENRDRMRQHLQHILSLYKELQYCCVEDEYRKSLILILYHFDSLADVEHFIQSQALRSEEDELSQGFVGTVGIGNLKGALDQLLPYMDWGISLGRDVLVVYPKVTRIQTISCIYPIELESRMKKAICDGDFAAVGASVSEFGNSFKDGRIYVPREIKECYVRFLWAMIGIAKEMGYLDQKNLEQQKLLGQIMNAKTKEELNAAAGFLVAFLDDGTEEDGVTHLTVKRVRSLVHEFYSTGITLDEIAERMHMTPEYIGTLFHKEVGVTFSSYIKNLRMNKAKELLCSTSLKFYEISEQIGYTDPKYFSRVFKETCGQLPGEYRKTQK